MVFGANGIGKHYVWSYYSHNKRNHGSTAVGEYSSFKWVARPGVQSKASAPRLGVKQNIL
ncbi:lactococcin 972 family bacteriocin [Staphylococcus aureus]